jgi:hypothetical protein
VLSTLQGVKAWIVTDSRLQAAAIEDNRKALKPSRMSEIQRQSFLRLYAEAVAFMSSCALYYRLIERCGAITTRFFYSGCQP